MHATKSLKAGLPVCPLKVGRGPGKNIARWEIYLSFEIYTLSPSAGVATPNIAELPDAYDFQTKGQEYQSQYLERQLSSNSGGHSPRCTFPHRQPHIYVKWAFFYPI
jgi:hypothetical protein